MHTQSSTGNSDIWYRAGLPDSTYVHFHTKKVGYIFEGLRMKNVGIYIFLVFTAILHIFMIIWYILRPLGIFFLILVRCVKENLANLVLVEA
jgi:hypothetical protein